MKIWHIISILLLIIAFIWQCGCCQDYPQPRYNYLENEYEYTEQTETLRYNYIEKKWQYAKPTDTLRYNYLEHRWEFVDKLIDKLIDK